MYDMYGLVDLLVEIWESPWMVELSRNSFKLFIMPCLPIFNIKIWCKESTQLLKEKGHKKREKNAKTFEMSRWGISRLIVCPSIIL